MAELASECCGSRCDALDAATPSWPSTSRARDRSSTQEFEAALRQLMTLAMEDRATCGVTIDTVFALKSLERIGDHAKNVAEHVVFLVSGGDMRHARG